MTFAVHWLLPAAYTTLVLCLLCTQYGSFLVGRVSSYYREGTGMGCFPRHESASCLLTSLWWDFFLFTIKHFTFLSSFSSFLLFLPLLKHNNFGLVLKFRSSFIVWLDCPPLGKSFKIVHGCYKQCTAGPYFGQDWDVRWLILYPGINTVVV